VLAKFIEHHNVGFAQAPREAVGDFRLVPKRLNLDRILSLRYERVVMNTTWCRWEPSRFSCRRCRTDAGMQEPG